jgi:hypothetical protein
MNVHFIGDLVLIKLFTILITFLFPAYNTLFIQNSVFIKLDIMHAFW